MHIDISEAQQPMPMDRLHAVSIVIRSFKGRRDVEVHLFRKDYDEAELTSRDFSELIGEPMEACDTHDPDSSKRILLEAFTSEERDRIVDFLSERYQDRVTRITASPLSLPIPAGLPPLSTYPEGKSIGFIRFDELPNYPLDFKFRGLYDLSRHEPLVRD